VKIMVCFGGDEKNKKILEVTAKYAKALDASVHVVEGLLVSSHTKQYLTEKSQETLNYAKSILEENGVTCETHPTFAAVTIADSLIDFAKENGIEMIIIGVRQKSKLGKLVFGSTAQHLILNAPCPVLSVS
jgi:nucleotide-binding universal stress UspA family protein